MARLPDFYSIDRKQLTVKMHPGQRRAYESRRRFVFMLAGTQGGKTCLGPWWLRREIYGANGFPGRGSGDYLGVTGTFDLFKLKFLPEFREVLEHVLEIGRYWGGMKVMELQDPETGRFWADKSDDRMWARIILRSADTEGGLESSTAKGAYLDEVGLKTFTLEGWEAIQRRLSLHQGRVLGSTSLYQTGWLKTEVFDRWAKGDPDYDVIQFDSVLNPAFPQAEWDRKQRDMPSWKFNMRYRGRYDKPAHLIYDAFDETLCKIPGFDIPENWSRYCGMDFGGVNMAALFLAEEPETKRLYAYREYLEGGKSTAQHASSLWDPTVLLWIGGSKSEEQQRREFRAAATPIPVQAPPFDDVESGIDVVYGLHTKNELMVFSNMARLLSELEGYSRKVGPDGEPTEQIEDKEKYHLLDCLRYVCSRLRGAVRKPGIL